MCATYSNHELRAEKHGRIVDLPTGAGIADALVIAAWEESSAGIAGMISAGSWCELQKSTRTDQDGRFVFPDVSRELDLSDRGTRLHLSPIGPLASSHDHTWQLLVFKPGYVRMGTQTDAKTLATQMRSNDSLVLEHIVTGDHTGCLISSTAICMDNFIWQLEAPETGGHFYGEVEIKTIRLQKVESLPRLWIYYNYLLNAARCSHGTAQSNNEPGHVELARSISSAVTPMPCSMSIDTPVSSVELKNFSWLNRDGIYDMKLLSRVAAMEEKETTDHVPPDQLSTTAGRLCHALNVDFAHE